MKKILVEGRCISDKSTLLVACPKEFWVDSKKTNRTAVAIRKEKPRLIMTRVIF